MSVGMTRRDFFTSLAAVAAVPSAALALPREYAADDIVRMALSSAHQGSFASSILPPFQDLEVDRYYTLQGGPYKDTGGEGGPYYYMGNMLVNTLRDWDARRLLDVNLVEVARRGFYLTPSQYFGKPWRQYDRIYLTESWMREFYRRHRDDTYEDWYRRYTEWCDALRDSGWEPEYDRMSRDELVAIGWKGVDIYRKEG